MPKRTKRVLIVDDDAQLAFIIKTLIEAEGLEAEIVQTAADAFDRLSQTPVDVMLLDLFIGNDSGMSILRELYASGSVIPIIIMTAHGSIETVAEAMHLNAFDYIAKPFVKEDLLEIVKRALGTSGQPKQDIKFETTTKTVPIIGQSFSMIEVYKAIGRVSQTDSTILISGESGTGKELVARAIHSHSKRAAKGFVAINCGALTETLLESELFGHVKGAFTGAHAAHRGIFESASGGTVFLDEISETSPSFQVKLLRVLQQRTIRPVGSSEEKPVNVRVIAATNQPTSALMQSSFRKDLLYRLSVINIHIPPLRDRVDDIPLLANYFLHRFNKRQGKSVTLPTSTLEWMKTLKWEGNVRELENSIERAVTMNATGEILPADLTQFGLNVQTPPAVMPTSSPDTGPPTAPTLAAPIPVAEPVVRISATAEEKSLDDVTRDHILYVLKSTGGNKLQAAKILGIGRYSLYRMAERLGLNLDEIEYDPLLARQAAKKRSSSSSSPSLELLDRDAHDLFDSVNDIVYTRDLEGIITSLNSAGEKFFGRKRQTLIGQTLHGLFGDSELEKSLRATNEKLIQEGCDRSIITVQDGSGRTRVLESNVSLMRDSDGKPSGARGIMRDITEAKELEEQLRRRSKELEEVNEKLKELDRIKADFTAMLVHDLKTPATSMILALEYLRDRFGKEGGPDFEKMVAAGLTSGRTLIQIVSDMLELFRFDSKTIELSRGLLPVNEIVEDPLVEATMEAERKQIEISRNLVEPLPFLFVDKLKMCRAVSNLVSNAIKFTPTGGKIKVEAAPASGDRMDEGKSFVRITVSDSGEGIPPEHLSYIFDPYWQASRKGVGTGLGLAVVKRIVSAHGGVVSVQSRVGVGSEFHITIPAAS